MTIFELTERKLASLPAKIRAEPEAALALELARQLDDDRPSLAMKAPAAQQYRDTMAVLRSFAAAAKAQQSDGLDDLKSRREKRRAKATG